MHIPPIVTSREPSFLTFMLCRLSGLALNRTGPGTLLGLPLVVASGEPSLLTFLPCRLSAPALNRTGPGTLLVHTSDRYLKRARAHHKAPQLAVECWGLSDSQLVAGASRVHMWIYIMGCGRQHGDVQWIRPIYWFCPIYPAR